jgi:hypothetical protein
LTETQLEDGGSYTSTAGSYTTYVWNQVSYNGVIIRVIYAQTYSVNSEGARTYTGYSFYDCGVIYGGNWYGTQGSSSDGSIRELTAGSVSSLSGVLRNTGLAVKYGVTANGNQVTGVTVTAYSLQQYSGLSEQSFPETIPNEDGSGNETYTYSAYQCYKPDNTEIRLATETTYTYVPNATGEANNVGTYDMTLEWKIIGGLPTLTATLIVDRVSSSETDDDTAEEEPTDASLWLTAPGDSYTLQDDLSVTKSGVVTVTDGSNNTYQFNTQTGAALLPNGDTVNVSGSTFTGVTMTAQDIYLELICDTDNDAGGVDLARDMNGNMYYRMSDTASWTKATASGGSYYTTGGKKVLDISGSGLALTYVIYDQSENQAYTAVADGTVTDHNAAAADANLVLITTGSMNYKLGLIGSTGEAAGGGDVTLEMDYGHASLIDNNDSGGTQNDNIISGGDFTFIAETDGTFGTSGNRIEVNVAGDTMYQNLAGAAVIAIDSYIEVQEGDTLTVPEDTIIDNVTVQIHGPGDLKGVGLTVQGANGLLDIDIDNVDLDKLGARDGATLDLDATGNVAGIDWTFIDSTVTVDVDGTLTLTGTLTADNSTVDLTWTEAPFLLPIWPRQTRRILRSTSRTVP